MARKTDIKTCRYKDCKHSSKEINIAEQKYMAVGRNYFHVDCYAAKEAAESAEAKLKADIQLIKNMWIENISDTVVLSQLYLELNKLIRERGISSDYVIFVLNYCIKNRCNLRYPGGLKYYVDKQEIKDAFAKKEAQKAISNATFSIDEFTEDNSPKFSVNKRPSGFSSILNRRK